MRKIFYIFILFFIFGLSDKVGYASGPQFPLLLNTASYFNGSYPGTPVGIGNWTSGVGELNVTGSASSTSLTINSVTIGTTTDYALNSGTPWAIVIEGDDGVYRAYTVTSVDTINMILTIYPSLDVATTNKPAGNMFDSYNGQHLTTMGYYGLADFLTHQTKRYSYMEKYADRYSYDGSSVTAYYGTAWASVGGLANGGYVSPTTCMYKGILDSTKNIFASVCTPYLNQPVGVLNSKKVKSIATTVLGQGASQTVNLAGKSGYLDTYLSIGGQQNSTTTASARVKVYIDGVLTYNSTFGQFTHLQVPFDHASTGQIQVLSDANVPVTIYVGNTTWFVWNDSDWGNSSPDESLIPDGSKVVIFEDSWGVYHNNAFATRLQENLPSSTITNVSVAGTQATWAISNYSSLVSPNNPDYVISNFQINDKVASVTDDQLLSNLMTLWNLTLADGATPIYLRSLSTASYNQMQTLYIADQNLSAKYPKNKATMINVVSSGISNNTATVTWSTDFAASSKVNYGMSPSAIDLSTSEVDTSPRTTSHSINLSSLNACSTYYFNLNGVTSLLDNSTSTTYSFNTSGCSGDSSISTSSSSIISTSSGGSLSLDGISISVPNLYTSTSSNSVFQIHKLDPIFFNSINVPDGKINVGINVFNLKSFTDSTTTLSSFDKPITITLAYLPDNIANINQSSLIIYRYDGSSWSPLSNCSVNTSNHTVTCSTQNFSDFALFGEYQQTTSNIGGGGAGNGSPNIIGLVSNGNKDYVSSTNLTSTPNYESLIRDIGVKINSIITQVNLLKNNISVNFKNNLYIGVHGNDVKLLQVYLNTHGFMVAQNGPGSLDQETMYFGKLTQEAVMKFQSKYGIVSSGTPDTTGYGQVGPLTRAKLNEIFNK